MTVMTNVVLVLKDSEGNIGIVKTLTDNDIIKIANAITDVGQVVDPATHMPIEATTASVGVVQLATAQDITNGTAGKVVDAQELNNFAQTLPAANGVTDVYSGDNSNQIVVSRIGGNKTLTIDNVEHAGTATSADSVAWDKVSGKPSSFTPASHTHDDRYYTESEIDTKLSSKVNRIDGGYKSITGDGKYSWCKLATITIIGGYINNPISFEIDGRGIARSIVQIMFENTADTDPSLASFTSDISTEFYIKKVATSKWELYGNYTEPWGSFYLYRVACNMGTAGGDVTIDTTPSNLSSEPSGTTRVSVRPSSYANSAGNADTLDGYHHDSFPKVNSALFTVNGLSSPGWSAIGTGEGGSCIQVRTTDNTYPSICFHRSGYSHCVLAELNSKLGTITQGGPFHYLLTTADIWIG